MRLSKMFKDSPTVNITGLQSDSRKVKPGDMYFALPGTRFDGHDFIEEALDRGALAVVHSRELAEKRPGAVYIRVEDPAEALNQSASIFYGRPARRMTMIGITGTNGKTSIANIIQHILGSAKVCGYIGTIAISYGNVVLPPDLTTPDPLMLMKTLSDMAQAGMETCVLEVSSHGLKQKRVDGISFDISVFTNFTYDHLDFHKTMEDYFASKSLLFSERTKKEGISIINVDDPKSTEIIALATAPVITYGIENKADFRAENIVLEADRTTFDLVYEGRKYPVVTNLVGRVNVSNLLAAIAAAHAAGKELEQILPRLDSIPQIPGRFERIEAGQPFEVVVDFAHTPDGMEKIMEYGKSMTREGGRMIAVFGSAGKRDAAKRKVFGEIADRYCTDIILTEDDPRDESAREIAAQIQEGIEDARVLFIEDRYEAIRQAIEKASPRDCVLILGKGDEPFMYREEGRAPWIGDNEAARECIIRLYGSPENEAS